MDIDACIKKIDRHLANDNKQPLIVDVQNRADLSLLFSHYKVSGNVFISVSHYCNIDEYPHIEALFDELRLKSERIFVTGISAFLKLQGEQVLRETLRDLLGMTVSGHVVVITYQCKKYLHYSDPRLKQRIAIIDGVEDQTQSLVFSLPEFVLPNNENIIQISGVQCIGDAVENKAVTKLYVKTKKQKNDYPNALFLIEELNNAYDILIQRDRTTSNLRQEYGTCDQWTYALDKLVEKKDWANLIDSEFGNHIALDITFSNFKNFDFNKQWLYFIALKLFGAKNNWCLNEASKKASSVEGLAREIYRSLLNVSKESPDFESNYRSRKSLISSLGNPMNEVINYCNIVQSKGKDSIFYLTDNTQKEKELIFYIIDKFGESYSRKELCTALNLVYPDLYNYLSSSYHFENDLLNLYFQDYKYQKVLNHIFPEFEQTVIEQAKKREYNLILEPRSSKIESISLENSKLYFIDAMGVEYLSYIMAVCSEFKLMASVAVCSCELPSITSKNKEFLEFFENNSIPVVSIKDLDDIKHHGKDDFDYQQTKLPIHLIKELEVLRDLLSKIKECLASGIIKKAILIADHGASRLAVIHETECIWEMSVKGEHSGRCCLKTDVDVQPEYATNAGEFWALANYDRFKGGRKANVEVHGGATLEEVTIPIIELTYRTEDIEIYLLPIDSTSISKESIPEITVSYRKKAAIKIFATAKLQNVRICVDGKFYDAKPTEDFFYVVEMPDIKHAQTYLADVYSGNNHIAEKQFKVKKEGSSEHELL